MAQNERVFNQTALFIWLIVLIFHVIIYGLAVKCAFRFPIALHSTQPDDLRFIEGNARRHLDRLVRFDGKYMPRPAGGYLNEKVVPKYIIETISLLQEIIHSTKKLVYDVQDVSGSFDLDFLGGFTSIYQNVTNIVAKLEPTTHLSGHSILINCHYDTIPSSPGASDDAVSCATMLEMLRVLAVRKEPMDHSVIFIFNGAEENILQAAHGFITQHKWAPSVRMFINLEAAGAGGPELVFQTGPENPWLIMNYAKFAARPSAQVAAQEFFSTGLIPSDTDFRIYRDFGNLSGIDIAYFVNGYIYHTAYDLPQYIDEGSIQKAGDNIVALVQGLVNSPQVANPGEYKYGKMVFFDYLGLFMIIYPHFFGTIINLVIAFWITVTLCNRYLGSSSGFSMKTGHRLHKRQFITSVCTTFAGFVITFLTPLIVACFMWMTNRLLSYYNWNINIVGIYFVPCLISFIAFHRLFVNDILNLNADLPQLVLARIALDASLVFWMMFLFILTLLGSSTAYLPTIWMFFPFCFNEFGHFIFGFLSSSRKVGDFLFVHLISILVPLSTFMHSFVFSFLETFIPLTGRIGSTVVPDLLIAGFVGVLVALLSVSNVALTHIGSKRSYQILLRVFSGYFILNLLLVLFTPLGFPYGFSEANPRMKRVIVSHTERSFHDIGNVVVHEDSGMILNPLDYTGIAHYKGHLSNMEEYKLGSCDGVYCGWPYYFPMRDLFGNVYFKAGPKHNKPIHIVPKLISRLLQPDGMIRISLELSINAAHRFTMQVQPEPDFLLDKWSLSSKRPVPTLLSEIPQKTYFVYYAKTKESKASASFSLWMDFKPKNHGGGIKTSIPVAKIAFCGFAIHGPDSTTELTDEVFAQLPPWAGGKLKFLSTFDQYIF